MTSHEPSGSSAAQQVAQCTLILEGKCIASVILNALSQAHRRQKMQPEGNTIGIEDSLKDLLRGMLAYDPSLRLSAEDCLLRKEVFLRGATLPDNSDDRIPTAEAHVRSKSDKKEHAGHVAVQNPGGVSDGDPNFVEGYVIEDAPPTPPAASTAELKNKQHDTTVAYPGVRSGTSTTIGRTPTPEQPEETAFLGEKGYVPKRVMEIEQREEYFSKLGQRGKPLAAGEANNSPDLHEDITSFDVLGKGGGGAEGNGGGYESEEFDKEEGDQDQDPFAAPGTSAAGGSSGFVSIGGMKKTAAGVNHDKKEPAGLGEAVEEDEAHEANVAKVSRELLAAGEGADEVQKAMKVLLRPQPKGELVASDRCLATTSTLMIHFGSAKSHVVSSAAAAKPGSCVWLYVVLFNGVSYRLSAIDGIVQGKQRLQYSSRQSVLVCERTQILLQHILLTPQE